jgi:hypothetical protein
MHFWFHNRLTGVRCYAKDCGRLLLLPTPHQSPQESEPQRRSSAVSAIRWTMPWPRASSPPWSASCWTATPGPPATGCARRCSTSSRSSTTPNAATRPWTSLLPPLRAAQMSSTRRIATVSTKTGQLQAVRRGPVEPSLLCPLDRSQVHARNSTTQAGHCNTNECPDSGRPQADGKPLPSPASARQALTCPPTADPGKGLPA